MKFVDIILFGADAKETFCVAFDTQVYGTLTNQSSVATPLRHLLLQGGHYSSRLAVMGSFGKELAVGLRIVSRQSLLLTVSSITLQTS